MKSFLLRSPFQTPVRPNLRSPKYQPLNPSSFIRPQSHIVSNNPPPIINTTSQQPAVIISLASKFRNLLATNFVDDELVRYPSVSPSSSSATSLINSVQTNNNSLLSEKKKKEEDEQYSSSSGTADSSSASSDGTWVAVIGKLTGAISIGIIVLLMLGMVDDDGHKALALGGGGGGPGGPMVEEFWENVRRYALYALTVSTGVIYTVFQPIVELLKNPVSAILVLVVIGGTIYIVSQVLSAMVGVSEFNYEYGY